jgi:hypothetical protein
MRSVCNCVEGDDSAIRWWPGSHSSLEPIMPCKRCRGGGSCCRCGCCFCPAKLVPLLYQCLSLMYLMVSCLASSPTRLRWSDDHDEDDVDGRSRFSISGLTVTRAYKIMTRVRLQLMRVPTKKREHIVPLPNGTATAAMTEHRWSWTKAYVYRMTERPLCGASVVALLPIFLAYV